MSFLYQQNHFLASANRRWSMMLTILDLYAGRGMWRDPGSLCTAVSAAGAEAIASLCHWCWEMSQKGPSNMWGFSGKDRKYLEVLNEAMAGSATWSTSLLKITGNSHFGVLIAKVRSFIFFSFSHRTPPKSNCMQFLYAKQKAVGDIYVLEQFESDAVDP